MILAIESSCDETAVAIWCNQRGLLASEISSQIEEHRPYGGVVPELASRNHVLRIRSLINRAMELAETRLSEIDAFAATAGPGLASSLLIGNTVAKSLAMVHEKPFLAINHMEGHLCSPFLPKSGGVDLETAMPPHLALIVSGGHTMLVEVNAPGKYRLIGQSIDDAAGEAFDKVAKMLGLPYPGGPEIERVAQAGHSDAFAFPRSLSGKNDFRFSFSGLKTSVLYTLDGLDPAEIDLWRPDICASFQQAVVDVLVTKTLRAAKANGHRLVAMSGGVSCNRALRDAMQSSCKAAKLDFRASEPAFATDNAAMIAFAAAFCHHSQSHSSLTDDVDPNLKLG